MRGTTRIYPLGCSECKEEICVEKKRFKLVDSLGKAWGSVSMLT